MGSVRFNSVTIGTTPGAFVIAEAGVNHNGDLELALRLIDVAADAGADAVKFQTFKAERLASPEAAMAEYQKANSGREESQVDMLRRLELDESAYPELIARCADRGVLFMSTPFDEESADLLEELGITLFKMPSGELTNTPFLKHVAAKGLPMIVSTGMSTLSDIETALAAIESVPNLDLAFLHCVSNYPADPADVNLRAMEPMRSFGYPVGYSDHTLGIAVSIAAVALGATVIEKHFTLDRAMDGPDHRASLEPAELSAMIAGIRAVEAALGDGRKRPAPSEQGTADVARKSLVAAVAIPAGTMLTREMLGAKRPGTGLPPSALELVLGRSTSRAIAKNEVLTADHLR